ncbi:hypothetical protein HYPBUDRAFT_153398, partial [Hyphopichia burtonii NRRL Y-1933]
LQYVYCLPFTAYWLPLLARLLSTVCSPLTAYRLLSTVCSSFTAYPTILGPRMLKRL